LGGAALQRCNRFIFDLTTFHVWEPSLKQTQEGQEFIRVVKSMKSDPRFSA